MASLGSLVIELAANTARLQSDLGKAVGMAESASSKMGSAFRKLSALAGGGALGALALRSIEVGDNLSKAAVKAGLGAKPMSELAYAAKQADVDLGGLSTSLRFMQKSLSEAATGAKGPIDALAALGLRIQDIKGLDADKQFELIGDRISKMKDPMDRARAATELFGKAGADMLPLFEQGAAGIRAAREEAERLGLSFSKDQLKALSDADDSIKRLKASFEGFAVTLTAKVAPGLTQFFNNMTAIATGDKIGKLKEQIDFLEGMKGRSFVSAGYGDIGTGYFNAEEGAAKLAELRAKLSAMTRTQGRGGQGRGKAGLDAAPPGYTDTAAIAAAQKARAKLAKEAAEAELEAYADGLRQQKQQVSDFTEYTRTHAELRQAEAKLDFQMMSDDFDAYVENQKQGQNQLSAYADQAARNMQDAFANFLFDPFKGGLKGMLSGFADMLRQMIAQAAAASILQSMFGSMGGLGGFLSKGLAGFGLAGARADGGPVSGGRTYLVGERGPELFTPGASGAITPNGAGGAVIQQSISIDARGSSVESVKLLQSMIPEVMRQSVAMARVAIMDDISRGALRRV